MNNLLKITTKPIKITVQVEKGKFIKVERSIQLKNHRANSKDLLIQSHNNDISKVEPLPKHIKLNQIDNNIHKIVNQSITQEDSHNVPFISQYNRESKIEPIPVKIIQELKYQPSDLDFVINQYSEIEFEYVGDPIYMPMSANPNKDK